MFVLEGYLSLVKREFDFTAIYSCIFLIDISLTISTLRYIENTIIDDYINIIKNGKLILSLITCLASIFGSECTNFINSNVSNYYQKINGEIYIVNANDIENIFKFQTMDFIITAYLLERKKFKKESSKGNYKK